MPVPSSPPARRGRRRRALAVGLAAVLVATGAALPAGATPTAPTVPAAPAAAGADPSLHFVDCAAPTDGDGTLASPWSSLDTVAAHVLEPGDRLLLKRGSTCHGALRTQGSGTEGAPIVLDAYGDPEDGYPVVAGGGVPDAVLLENQEHWEVRNLEITNVDADPAARYTAQRRGLTIRNVDQGQLSHFRVEGLYIHDVLGEGKKDLGGSGAIQLEVDTRDGVTRSWFDDTVISGNLIENVNRSGINMSTAWKCRAEMAWDAPCDPRRPADRPFTPSTGLIVRDNTLSGVGGDGIVVQMNEGAIVESNYLEDGSNRSNSHNAGIWVWNSDDTLFQYNVVTNSQKISQNDGTAWDADYGSRNTVFQYNLSYDNAGGGMFYCGCGDWKIDGLGFATDATYRYNLSVGDGQAADLLDVPGNENTNRFQFLSGVTDSSSYNNTIILPEGLPDASGGGGYRLNGTNSTGSGLLLANNLFVTTGEIAPDTYDSTTNVLSWVRNAFSGPAQNWPEGSGNVEIAETLLRGVDGTSPVDAFLARSAELEGAGQRIAPAGTYDIQGNPVVASCAPDIGAFQVSDQAAQDCADAWTDRDVEAGSSLVVPVRANATVRVTGTTAGEMVVTNDAGLAHVATPDPAGTVSTVVRTATDADPALTIACDEGCAGVSVTDAADDMIDGSFESLKNTPWYLSPWRTWHSPWSGPEAERRRQAAELRTRDGAAVSSGQLAARITAAEPRLAQDNLRVEPGAGYRLTGWVAPADVAAPLTVRLVPFVDNVVGTQVLASFGVPAGGDGLVRLDERLTLPDDVTAVTLVITQDGLAGTQEAYLDDLTLTRDDSAPEVVREPGDVTVHEGELAAFLAGFAGNDVPAVAWERLEDGAWEPVTATRLGQEGQVERTPRLVLDDVALADSGSRFRAVATNAAGTATTREVTLTVEPATGTDPVAPVVAEAQSRCLAGKAHVAVRATNVSDAAVDVELVTPFGQRAVARVVPDAAAYQSFAVRSAHVADGTATVRVGGEVVAEPGYAALDCG